MGAGGQVSEGYLGEGFEETVGRRWGDEGVDSFSEEHDASFRVMRPENETVESFLCLMIRVGHLNKKLPLSKALKDLKVNICSEGGGISFHVFFIITNWICWNPTQMFVGPLNSMQLNLFCACQDYAMAFWLYKYIYG